MPRCQPRMRIISLTVALFFLTPYLTWAFETVAYPPAAGEIRLNHQTLHIPPSIGTITASHRGGESLVVFVQDLHCNNEVQHNLARLIDGLARRHGLPLVGVEGASQAINVTKLSTFPKDSVKRWAADYLVKQGKLTGPEWYAALGGRKIALEGVETASLYQEELSAAASLLTDESLGCIYDFRALLDELKDGIYTPELLLLDRRRRAYLNGETPLLKYAAFLSRAAAKTGEPMDRYPALAAFLKASEDARNAIPDGETPAAELARLDQALRRPLLVKPEQLEMDALYRRLETIEKLISISATPEDLAEFRAKPEAYRAKPFLDFIARHKPAANLLPEDEIRALDRYLEQARIFYRIADARSASFVDNLSGKMAARGARLSLLVAGGYHTPEVLKALRKRNLSYVCIKPRITRQDAINPYFSLLRNRRTPLEKLIARNQSFLALPSPFDLGNPDRIINEAALPADSRLVFHLIQLVLTAGDLAEEAGKTDSPAELARAFSELVAAYPANNASLAPLWDQARMNPKTGVAVVPFPDGLTLVIGTRSSLPPLSQALETLSGDDFQVALASSEQLTSAEADELLQAGEGRLLTGADVLLKLRTSNWIAAATGLALASVQPGTTAKWRQRLLAGIAYWQKRFGRRPPAPASLEELAAADSGALDIIRVRRSVQAYLASARNKFTITLTAPNGNSYSLETPDLSRLPQPAADRIYKYYIAPMAAAFVQWQYGASEISVQVNAERGGSVPDALPAQIARRMENEVRDRYPGRAELGNFGRPVAFRAAAQAPPASADGRLRVPMTYAAEAPGVRVAVDLGGTGIKVAASADGRRTGKDYSRPTFADPEHGGRLQELIDNLDGILRTIQEDLGPIDRLAVNFPGPVDLEKKKIIDVFGLARGFKGDDKQRVADLLPLLAEKTGIRLANMNLGNDLHGHAAYLSGLLPKAEDTLVLAFGTGVGGAFIRSNGDIAAEGEFHIPVDTLPGCDVEDRAGSIRGLLRIAGEAGLSARLEKIARRSVAEDAPLLIGLLAADQNPFSQPDEKRDFARLSQKEQRLLYSLARDVLREDARIVAQAMSSLSEVTGVFNFAVTGGTLREPTGSIRLQYIQTWLDQYQSDLNRPKIRVRLLPENADSGALGTLALDARRAQEQIGRAAEKLRLEYTPGATAAEIAGLIRDKADQAHRSGDTDAMAEIRSVLADLGSLAYLWEDLKRARWLLENPRIKPFQGRLTRAKIKAGLVLERGRARLVVADGLDGKPGSEKVLYRNEFPLTADPAREIFDQFDCVLDALGGHIDSVGIKGWRGDVSLLRGELWKRLNVVTFTPETTPGLDLAAAQDPLDVARETYRTDVRISENVVPDESGEVYVQPLGAPAMEKEFLENRFDSLSGLIAQAQAEGLEVKPLFINSTSHGGGVAIMRHGLLRFWNLLGLNARWLVMEGNEDIFAVTKGKLHNALHGIGVESLDERDIRLLKEWSRREFEKFKPRILESNFIVIDDQQPAGMIPLIRQANPKAVIVWRNHIQYDVEAIARPGSPADTAWQYISENLAGIDAAIFHQLEFAPHDWREKFPDVATVQMEAARVETDGMNKSLSGRQLDYYRRVLNELLAGQENQPALDPDRPLITQVARFDPAKGIHDVMNSYRVLCQWLRWLQAPVKLLGRVAPGLAGRLLNALTPQLLVIGNQAADDPDFQMIHAACTLKRTGAAREAYVEAMERILTGMFGSEDIPEKTSKREDYERIIDEFFDADAGARAQFQRLAPDIKIVAAPHDDLLLNAAVRLSKITLQLSNREGFEHKVTEELSKGIVTIVYRAGGLPRQVENGQNGFIVKIGDYRRVAGHLFSLLTRPARYRKMSAAAARITRHNFIIEENGGKLLTLFLRLKNCPERAQFKHYVDQVQAALGGNQYAVMPWMLEHWQEPGLPLPESETTLRGDEFGRIPGLPSNPWLQRQIAAAAALVLRTAWKAAPVVAAAVRFGGRLYAVSDQPSAEDSNSAAPARADAQRPASSVRALPESPVPGGLAGERLLLQPRYFPFFPALQRVKILAQWAGLRLRTRGLAAAPLGAAAVAGLNADPDLNRLKARIFAQVPEDFAFAGAKVMLVPTPGLTGNYREKDGRVTLGVPEIVLRSLADRKRDPHAYRRAEALLADILLLQSRRYYRDTWYSDLGLQYLADFEIKPESAHASHSDASAALEKVNGNAYYRTLPKQTTITQAQLLGLFAQLMKQALPEEAATAGGELRSALQARLRSGESPSLDALFNSLDQTRGESSASVRALRALSAEAGTLSKRDQDLAGLINSGILDNILRILAEPETAAALPTETVAEDTAVRVLGMPQPAAAAMLSEIETALQRKQTPAPVKLRLRALAMALRQSQHGHIRDAVLLTASEPDSAQWSGILAEAVARLERERTPAAADLGPEFNHQIFALSGGVSMESLAIPGIGTVAKPVILQVSSRSHDTPAAVAEQARARRFRAGNAAEVFTDRRTPPSAVSLRSGGGVFAPFLWLADRIGGFPRLFLHKLAMQASPLWYLDRSLRGIPECLRTTELARQMESLNGRQINGDAPLAQAYRRMTAESTPRARAELAKVLLRLVRNPEAVGGSRAEVLRNLMFFSEWFHSLGGVHALEIAVRDENDDLWSDPVLAALPAEVKGRNFTVPTALLDAGRNSGALGFLKDRLEGPYQLSREILRRFLRRNLRFSGAA